MSVVIWLTGLPCSGKSTIAKKLASFIPNLAILDGDEVRQWFSNYEFTKDAIIKNNKIIANIAKLLYLHGVPVCVALVSPYHENRDTARQIIGTSDFIEVYLKCPVEVCEQRDTKGMYKKAREGLIQNFIGTDNRYEPPNNPEVVVTTDSLTVEESVCLIVNYINKKSMVL